MPPPAPLEACLNAADAAVVHGAVAGMKVSYRGDAALEIGDSLGFATQGRVGWSLDDLRRTAQSLKDGRE